MISDNFFVGIISGIISGILTVLILWLWRVKIFVPKLIFGSHLCKVIKKDNKHCYYFIFKNIGKRNIVDIVVKSFIYIQGIAEHDRKLKIGFEAPTQIRRIVLEKKSVSAEIYLEQSDTIFLSTDIPEYIKNKIKIKEDSLEQLLGLGKEAYLVIIVMGSDEISGSRKYFRSKEYRIENIKKGRFERKTMEVICDEEHA